MPTIRRQVAEDAVKDVSFRTPHLWILGAGASVHALPQGDRNGRRLPVMNNLVELVGLQELLDDHSVEFRDKNFEGVYDSLSRDGQHETLCREIEQSIARYFAGIQLPDEPCLYDYLVWSLRSKDVITTFNWDPLLWQACIRAAPYFDPPRTIFLHGNVAVGYCMEDMVKGTAGTACGKCGMRFAESRLLYPVSQKNYTDDPQIASEWKDIKNALKSAYYVTVFGYSAPQTDVEAIAMLQEGWGKSDDRQLEQFSMIDIRPCDEVAKSWESFTHSHHYECYDNFYDTWLIKHPRRSCEALFSAVMNNAPYRNDPLPRLKTFDDLKAFFEPYFAAEAG